MTSIEFPDRLSERRSVGSGQHVSYVRQCVVIIILMACQREIEDLPEVVRGDLADALARLDAGLMLTMPLSRPMPTIGGGVHELRLRDRSGTYRIVYALIRRGMVHVLHAFRKTTETTPDKSLALARKRFKEILP